MDIQAMRRVHLAGERSQQDYYERSAPRYDDMHGVQHSEHDLALQHVLTYASFYELSSFLDVGSGTGRALRVLRKAGAMCVGVEPVAGLITQAVQKGIPASSLVRGSGYGLPFRDRSFDGVVACGVLHHVESPAGVIREMMRVARKAVFISDSNRFGQGNIATRWLKLALSRLHMWNFANFIKTRGRGYTVSEGDGVAYSYSVFDSFDLLAGWADWVHLIPTGQTIPQTWFSPLLAAQHLLLVAYRS
jgi:ubiquinone/menaquinone biosynthesis C-methylase UbiE